jgi:hypothetical protein
MCLVFKTGNLPPKNPHPATMTPKVITSALAAAQALFVPIAIDGQPSNNDLVHLSNTISPILLKSTYNHVNGVHNLWGLVANADRYLYHYGAPFVRPATRPACYGPAINTEASHVDNVHAKLLGPQRSKTTGLMRPLSMVSRSSSRQLCKTHGFMTFVILRCSIQMLQPLPSSTIFASIPAVYMHRTWYCSLSK